jgi:hypothetical protein
LVSRGLQLVGWLLINRLLVGLIGRLPFLGYWRRLVNRHGWRDRRLRLSLCFFQSIAFLAIRTLSIRR